MKRQADADNFIWNSIGGILNAGQSVLLLMVITRTCGLAAAGIFSIAFATGNLFMYLGNYGVRNYQVSDLKEQYSFGDYVRHRLCTVLLMLTASAAFVGWSLAFGGYSSYKAGCTAAMCCLKAVDCLEEVFEGRYQQRGRLDRSGKLVTFRLIVSIGGMMAALTVTRDLLLSTWIGVALAVLSAAVMIWHFRDTAGWEKLPAANGEKRYPAAAGEERFPEAAGRAGELKIGRRRSLGRQHAEKVWGLMKACFPVCAANFLSFYLINEPKYAIDAAMDETAQACYNFIAMPVFVIQLLNMFMYQPMLVRMTVAWKGGDRRKFLGYFGRITAGLVVIAVPVLLCAWLIGIPVLSLLYATDLTAYRTDLVLILVGGIFLAYNGFCLAVLTITRAQNQVPAVYLAGSIVSFFLTPVMVRCDGIRGAVLAFILIMALVTLLLTGLFARTLRKAAK